MMGAGVIGVFVVVVIFLGAFDSIAGNEVHPFAGAAYATSKAALKALTREMAHDFGPLGVRVNAIAPGEIETAILSPGTDINGAAKIREMIAEANRDRILDYFGGTEANWQDWHWHLRHIVTDRQSLEALVPLTDDERAAIDSARGARLPFGVTPYYASLMDADGQGRDRAIRAQVIPPSVEYSTRRTVRRPLSGAAGVENRASRVASQGPSRVTATDG